MVFFDLNVPYLEGDDRGAGEKENSGRRAARLKVVVKLMELGYTGAAYNRTIRGVMSDSDRCKIPYFPLSSLLKAAPTLSSAVGFHRELLGVPSSAPFRQYTRLTVGVDSAIAAAALNSGNPVLRTYDLVAVRPFNQVAFDQACKVSEVDLISIDFSQNLPFRLKLPMVKAAIERGVYFEITYSHLISDVHVRRKMLSGAKLLVDWTRGKNLIFSSAAPTVTELRGPYDVANLSSLLGLSMERAKAAISRNCRSLLANTLRKKHCYKQAIRIEKLPPDKQVDSKQAWFSDWNNWDPISSGEGDLPSLDDIAKHFSVASKVSKSYSASDFVSVADGMSSKDWIFNDRGNLVLAGGIANSLSTNREPEPSFAVNETPHKDMPIEVPVLDKISFAEIPLEHIISVNNDGLVLPSDTTTYFSDSKESCCLITEKRTVRNSNGSDTSKVGILSYDTPSQSCIPAYEGKLESMDDSPTLFFIPEEVERSDVCREDPESSDRLGIISCFGAGEVVADELEASIANSMDIDPSLAHVEEVKRLSGLDAVFDASNVPQEQAFASGEDLGKEDSVLDAFGVRMQDDLPKNDLGEQGDGAMPSTDPSLAHVEEVKWLSGLDAVLDAHNVPQEQAFASREVLGKNDSVLDAYGVKIQEDPPKNDLREQGNGVMPSIDNTLFEKSFDQMNVQEQGDVVSVADDVLLNEYVVKLEGKKHEGSLTASGVRRKKIKSGKNRLRKKLGSRALPFPFKGFLNPRLFKKKVPQYKRSRKHLTESEMEVGRLIGNHGLQEKQQFVCVYSQYKIAQD